MDWRRKMNGLEDSNMIKIDEVLGTKALQSFSIDATLTADAWVESEDSHTQEILIDGLTAEQNGLINVAQSATASQRLAARDAILSILEQKDGSLIIVSDGTLPEEDIPVCVILIG